MMKSKVYHRFTMISFLFVGFMLNNGLSFWVTRSLPMRSYDRSKPFNGCLYNRQQRGDLPCLFTMPVEQVDRQSGEVINTFPSVAEAVRTLGNTAVRPNGISKVIHGKHRSCGGYFWRRLGDKTMPPQGAAAAAPVEQVDLQSGETIHTFPSAAEAVRTLGNTVSSHGISVVLHGKRKSCGGYFWRRAGDKTMPRQRTFGAIPVEQVDIQSGETINTFPSAAEAGRTLGNIVSSNGICMVIGGKIRSCGGYFWRRPGDKTMPPQRAYERTITSMYDTMNKDDQDDLSRLISTLSSRDQAIMRMRFGLDDGRPKSLQKIGDHFSLTRERVRQIEAQTLQKHRQSKISSNIS